MLKLSEWLTRVGFQHGNPFALKEADREGEKLQSYFVEHPAYNQLLDAKQPTSGILAAPRGAGKSALRRMFETSYTSPSFEQRILLVRLTNWMPIVAEINQPHFANAQYHLDELTRLIVAALAAAPELPATQPQSADLLGYLNWLCAHYSAYLTPSECARLEQRGWLLAPTQPGDARYSMDAMPQLMRLSTISRILQSLGFDACYILIDRIDELFATSADWYTGAKLLAPLICNLQLNEIPNLGFKYFIPSEIVQLLQYEYGLRVDRLTFANLSWNTAQLLELLQTRLKAFSNDFISSLAALALPNLPNIDHQLVAAAAGSPRNLLNLGDWLFQACAADAKDQELRIRPEHLAAAQAQLNRWLQHTRRFGPGEPGDLLDAGAGSADPAQIAQPSPPQVPRLRVQDGVVWRGEHILQGWQDLPQLQHRLLQYLYDQRGKVCNKEAIIAYVWVGKDTPAGDDSLRKLAERLIAFIEPNPAQPVYIQKVRGGHYRLDHAEDA